MSNYKRFSIIAAATLFLSVLPSRESLFAQTTPAEVQAAANEALVTGNYQAAIHWLGLLVNWYENERDQAIVAMLGEVYFSLGLSHLFMGDFAKAEEVFGIYLSKYRLGTHAEQAELLVADCRRYQQNYPGALQSYQFFLERPSILRDNRIDAHAGIARIHLAEERWSNAVPHLLRVYRDAVDFPRQNWSATLLAISFLKDNNIEAVFEMNPILLRPDSFAARSVSFNVTALEVGDMLFSEERYREALWVYRLVYPIDEIKLNATKYLDDLERNVNRLRRNPRNPRPVMRAQEAMGETEAEIEALANLESYDNVLQFRVARGYMELYRHREARDLFYQIHLKNEPEFVEIGLYLAFANAARVEPPESAFRLGYEYIEKFPGGEFYSDTTLLVAQLHAKLEQWDRVLLVLEEALQVEPEHSHIVEVLFLLGYASFMEERFSESVDWLTRMNRDYPDNWRKYEGLYWTAMSLLFDSEYGLALAYFQIVIEQYPDGPYLEDAQFRYATCLYGLRRFEDAEMKLLEFIQEYPASRLVGEAYVMLGDIAGERGDIPLAVERFQKIPEFGDAVHIEFYNYSQFKAGEMLGDMEKYTEMIAHFRLYIARGREESNIPQALFWIGEALWKMDRRADALHHYIEAMNRYGRDRVALGVDLIMDAWIGKSRGADEYLRDLTWRDVKSLHEQAVQERALPLVLRLERVLLYEPNLTETERENRTRRILTARVLPHASVGVLDFILYEAQRREMSELADQTANEILTHFPETDTAIAAHMHKAREAFKRQAHEDVLAHTLLVQQVFPGSDAAAEAFMLSGETYRLMQQYEDADAMFQTVLAAKDWRRIWPEALFRRGDNARESGEIARASAFYERIYLLYSANREWTSKAYLARAECLLQMNEPGKALEVLREFLSHPDLTDRPEREAAQRMVARIGSAS